MVERKKLQPERITIREFRLVKGRIDSPFDFRMSNIKGFNYDVELETGINLEEELIKADFIINLSTHSEVPNEAVCSYHFVFLFNVEGLSDHVQMNEDGVADWNPYLANAIASITYSTSRGILMSRFQGTVMKDFILPVIDPNVLLSSKIVSQSDSRA